MAEQWLIHNATVYGADDVSTKEKIIDAIIDTNKLGTGKDSWKFEAKLNTVNFDYAGKMDKQVMEAEEPTGWDVKLSGDLLDMNTNLMGLSLMVKNTTDITETTYDLYEPSDTITNTNFTNLIVVGKLKNLATGVKGNGIIIVKNTYNSNGLNVEFKDKEDNAWSVEFKGMYTLDGDKPFAVMFPNGTAA